MLSGVPLISTVEELRSTSLVMGDLPNHLGLGDLLISNEAVQVAQQASEEATREVELRNERLSASLHEKEILLKEIHHRVKNNLQIISSLLMLQADKMPSEAAKELLKESVLRVRSMALIHQQLYGVDSLSKVDLGAYACSLSRSLASLLAPTARIQVESHTAWVTVDTAVPIGLILNELVTNALKYGVSARPPEGQPRIGRTGEHCDVLIEVGLVEGQIRIAVLDSGESLPEGFDPTRSVGLGMQLVRALTRQLRGKLEFDVDRGTRFVMTCPPEE
jgi:two-component sensor histidine kinase